MYNAAKFDRIMLGFRPIAPKPASRGSSFGKLSTERKDKCVRRTGRGRKRRSFTSSTSSSDKTKHSVSRKRQRKSSENEIGGDAVESAAVVTLPLLPPELEANEERNIHKNSVGFSIPSTWLRLQTRFVQQQHHQSVQKVVETWVTVESVTDSCMVDACGLGRTDEQKRMALETDSCPGMISDVLGRVIWTNDKFIEMVAGGAEGSEVAVWFVWKATTSARSAFTCSVRVQYMCGKEMKGSVLLPCDVWSMDVGGFAWRLDVQAALSLGR